MPRAKRTWKPITLEELKGLGRRIDCQYLFAPVSKEGRESGFTGPSEPIYRRMEKLQKKGFVNFGGPVLHNGELVIVMIKPREE